MDYANTTNVEFIVDPKVLFHGWWIYSYLHISWSSNYQGSVQIGSLTTLWHDHIACIDDSACPDRKQDFDKLACAEPWTCPFNAILPQFFKKKDSWKPIALSSRKRFFLWIALSTLWTTGARLVIRKSRWLICTISNYWMRPSRRWRIEEDVIHRGWRPRMFHIWSTSVCYEELAGGFEPIRNGEIF